MGEVLCNNDNCIHNQGRVCMAVRVGIVDGQCVTKRKAKKQDNYRDLMRPPFNSNCKRSQTGYKATHVQVFK